MTSTSSKSLAEQLIETYGPMLGGRNLYSALGFKTYSAFYRSMQRNEIGVKIFNLPGRRGWFALTTDIADWLEAQSNGVIH